MKLLEQVREHVVGARDVAVSPDERLSVGAGCEVREPRRLQVDDLEILLDRSWSLGHGEGYAAGVRAATERARLHAREIESEAETRGAVGVLRTVIEHVRPGGGELATSEEFDTRRSLVEELNSLMRELTREGVSGERKTPLTEALAERAHGTVTGTVNC